MKVIAVNGKVLLANGKAVKPTEVKADNFVDTICEVAGNNNVSSNWLPVVTAEEHIPKKYYYNGVLLPELPADALAQYPYAWIRKNTTTGYYNLILTALQPYLYTDGTSIAYGSGTSTTCVLYNIAISSAESATEWTYENKNNTWHGLDSARTVLWSNHDIPNGSATATEIYFNGSEPVLAE